MKPLFNMLLAGLLAACLIPAHAGLNGWFDSLTSRKQPTLHIILIDTTDSVAERDRLIYRQSIARELEAVSRNDRVVVAPISGAHLGEFVLHADVTWNSTGRHFDDLATARKASLAVHAAAEPLLKPAAASATRLLDAFSALGPLVAQARGQGMAVHLLVLSDMVEESETLNLARRIPNAEETARLLRKQQAEGLIPDFNKVSIAMVGAAGADARASAAIQQFWRSYIAQTQATLSYYGRLAPMSTTAQSGSSAFNPN